jgi:hypothetical protein
MMAPSRTKTSDLMRGTAATRVPSFRAAEEQEASRPCGLPNEMIIELFKATGVVCGVSALFGVARPAGAWRCDFGRSPRDRPGRKQDSVVACGSSGPYGKVGREDPGELAAQELLPGQARAAGRRISARGAPDLPPRGRCHRHAELRQLAMDPPVSPKADSPSPGERQGWQCWDLSRDRRRAAGPAPLQPLPEPVDLEQYCVRRQTRVGGRCKRREAQPA